MKEEFDTRKIEGFGKLIKKYKVQKNHKKKKKKRKNKGYSHIRLCYAPINIKMITLTHRLIVENFIHRRLTDEESVHHLDHNKSNNNINNLMLFPNQKAHEEFESRIKKEGMTDEIKKIIEDRWKS